MIEDAWISKLLCEVTFSWRPGKLLCGLKTLLFLWISRIWIAAQTWFLARLFLYLFSFISQILNSLYWLVCIFIFDDVTKKTQNATQYSMPPLHLLLFSSKNKNPTIIVWHYLVFLHPVFSMSIKIVCTKSVGSFESGRFVLINITLFAPLKTAWNLFSCTVPFNFSTSLARAFSTSSSSLSSSLELLGWSPCRLCSGPYNWSAYWKLLP